MKNATLSLYIKKLSYLKTGAPLPPPRNLGDYDRTGKYDIYW